MKLFDLIISSDDEITVWDENYDIESYFYGIKSSRHDMDKWDKAMTELSKLLDIVSTSGRGVTVNLSALIEKNIRKLDKAKLFTRCTVDDIMDDIMAIFSGNVSEDWLQEFVDVLKSEERS